MPKPSPAEPLGELEKAVMDVVWTAGGSLTAREACDRFTGGKARAYTTIMTTMDRLHKKGLLLREKDGLAWRYAAAMSRERYHQQLASSLAQSLVRAHGPTALAAFVDAAAGVSDKELDRLAELVAARKRGSHK